MCKMRLSVRLYLFYILFVSLILSDNGDTNKRKGKHFLMLLGFLHGYKVGQDIALKYPSYLISPVVILPSVNQQQSVNIQSGSNDENYQESAGSFQVITKAKLIDKTNFTTNEDQNLVIDDIKVNFETSKKPFAVKNERLKTTTENNFAMNDDNIVSIGSEMFTTMSSIAETTETVTNKTTTLSPGKYPTPSYNNDNINSLTLTTVHNEDLALPPVSDNRWQNFSLRANLSDLADGNMTLIEEQLNNTLSLSTTEIVTEYPVGTDITISNNGKYPNALYNNAVIDQLSITTNSYTNEGAFLPPPYNDRWGSFSPSQSEASSFLKPNGFKPLAGLYYDGFLHKPLKKYPFITKNNV